LTEVYSILPLDDARDDGHARRPDPNSFHAFIDGNNLSVGAYTDVSAYVKVITV
jgi:hypothetical protein